MRIVFFGNNKLACSVLAFLKQRGDDVVGLILHPQEKRKFGDQLLDCAGLTANQVFTVEQLLDEEIQQQIKTLKADIGVSVLFGYILRKDVVDLFPKGCINLHPAYLPYNRGAFPNVWSVVEGTPAGVTIHRIDEGVDTGAILAQEMVEILPTDTGRSLYQRLEQTALQLFEQTWPDITNGNLNPKAQPQGGTSHKLADVEKIDEIDLDKMYSGRQLIDILRARTFPPYKGAYYVHNGRRIYLRLELFDEAELS